MGQSNKPPLTQVERERIADSRLKIQSVADSLKKVDPQKVQQMEDIQDCLEDADETLKSALGSKPETSPAK